MMRSAFTGNAGSKRKILVGGSRLIGELNKLNFTRVVSNTETITKWGIDFTEISSKFGRVYVLLSEVFDDCGMEDCGMIIDPEYIQKYSHLQFGTEALDLKSAGVRNTDALVVNEASCLVLRYPKAHMRVRLSWKKRWRECEKETVSKFNILAQFLCYLWQINYGKI